MHSHDESPLPEHQAGAQTGSDAVRYLALRARDARFDGRFFTGVTSTGIYCRPICRVRTPRAENCRFFDCAAQAEGAGFRPCMRCRPELAPANTHWLAQTWTRHDASAVLAQQAAALIDHSANWTHTPLSVATVAARLGVSTRHLHRIFESHWGIAPLRYLQTRRLLTAKQLLTDTRIAIAEVAQLSGFASVRRFNDTFVSHYRMQPRALRATPAAHSADTLCKQPPHAGFSLYAAYRPPFDYLQMLAFFAQRAVQGLEHVDPASLSLTRALRIEHHTGVLHGWVQARFEPQHHRIAIHTSESLSAALPSVLARVKAWLDVDADPASIEPVLEKAFPQGVGLRVPGTVDGFELAVRAVLGQQVTLRAAHTLTQRLVDALGEPLNAAPAPIQRCFPSAQALASLDGDALGRLGIITQRQRAIRALAHAVHSGTLALHPGAPIASTLQTLQALPGIGAWTAQYIAMRALRWPDAFVAGDVVVHKALGVRNAARPAQAAEELSQAWRPWRAYATVRMWHAQSTQTLSNP